MRRALSGRVGGLLSNGSRQYRAIVGNDGLGPAAFRSGRQSVAAVGQAGQRSSGRVGMVADHRGVGAMACRAQPGGGRGGTPPPCVPGRTAGAAPPTMPACCPTGGRQSAPVWPRSLWPGRPTHRRFRKSASRCRKTAAARCRASADSATAICTGGCVCMDTACAKCAGLHEPALQALFVADRFISRAPIPTRAAFQQGSLRGMACRRPCPRTNMEHAASTFLLAFWRRPCCQRCRDGGRTRILEMVGVQGCDMGMRRSGCRPTMLRHPLRHASQASAPRIRSRPLLCDPAHRFPTDMTTPWRWMPFR